MSGEPIRLRIDHPYPGDRFPADLGAFVAPSVLDGSRPALYVAHNEDGTWVVFDNEGDPNEDGALIVARLRHAVAHDPSLEEVASWPRGVEGIRDAPGLAWRVRELVEPDE